MVNSQQTAHGPAPHSNGAGVAHANGPSHTAVPPLESRDGRSQDLPPSAYAAQARVDVAAPPPRADATQISHAFQLAQEGLRAMQSLQQQTAYAHQKFLEGQEAAHRSFQMVMQQQQRMLDQSVGLPIAPLTHVPTYTPPLQPSFVPAPAPAPYIPQPHTYASPVPLQPASSAPPQYTQQTPAAPAPHAPVSIQPIPLDQHTSGTA
ncbi:MAG: hypothetical protein AB7N71_00380, partial [Phycisphaerae bacterium]